MASLSADQLVKRRETIRPIDEPLEALIEDDDPFGSHDGVAEDLHWGCVSDGSAARQRTRA